jgi:hypothetical protein
MTPEEIATLMRDFEARMGKPLTDATLDDMERAIIATTANIDQEEARAAELRRVMEGRGDA